MWLIAGVDSFAAGPETWTSLCGITSLFVTTATVPRASFTDRAALKGEPFTAHVWQPCIWWRMTMDARGAEADATLASARAATATVAIRPLIAAPFGSAESA